MRASYSGDGKPPMHKGKPRGETASETEQTFPQLESPRSPPPKTTGTLSFGSNRNSTATMEKTTDNLTLCPHLSDISNLGQRLKPPNLTLPLSPTDGTPTPLPYLIVPTNTESSTHQATLGTTAQPLAHKYTTPLPKLSTHLEAHYNWTKPTSSFGHFNSIMDGVLGGLSYDQPATNDVVIPLKRKAIWKSTQANKISQL